jgi:hypothetical protein
MPYLGIPCTLQSRSDRAHLPHEPDSPGLHIPCPSLQKQTCHQQPNASSFRKLLAGEERLACPDSSSFQLPSRPGLHSTPLLTIFLWGKGEILYVQSLQSGFHWQPDSTLRSPDSLVGNRMPHHPHAPNASLQFDTKPPIPSPN